MSALKCNVHVVARRSGLMAIPCKSGLDGADFERHSTDPLALLRKPSRVPGQVVIHKA